MSKTSFRFRIPPELFGVILTFRSNKFFDVSSLLTNIKQKPW